MIIKSLKARILRALKSSLPAAASPPPSPTKPGAVRAVHAHADAFSDDASFFDAREAETPTKGAGEEPLDAWELVDQAAADVPAPDPADDPLLLPPPGGESRAVLYTTTLRGVRRTFEDCNALRSLLENLGAPFEERDVSMDRGLRDQLWAAAGEKAVPPRLFVRGRDVGGAAQALALHEEGRLVPLLLSLAPNGDGGKQARQEKGAGFGGGRRRQKCEACGGRRFVVCGGCDGSRRAGDGARCPRCNENGLAACPLCGG